MRITLSPLDCIQAKSLLNATSTAFSLVALVLGLVAPAQAKPAGDSLKPSGQSVELTDLRTRHSKTFQNPNGTRTWSASLGSVHFQDERGSWQDIDTEIRPLSAGPYAYGMTRNAYHSFFAADAAGPVAARFETAHWGVSFGVSGGQKGAVHLQGNQITYLKALAGADLRFTTRQDEVREEILLHQRPAVTEWEFELNLEGVRLESGDAGTLDFVDIQTGQRVWFMPKPFMFDASGARSEAVTKQLLKRNDRTFLRVNADTGWLAAPERAYPVTVDPTWSATTPSADTYVSQLYSSINYGAVTYMRVAGSGYSNGKCQSLIKWDMTGAPAPSTVNNAPDSCSVSARCVNVTNATAYTIDCYQVSGTWTELGVTWANKPGTGTKFASVSVGDKDAVYTWAWNGYNNIPDANGVLLDLNSEQAVAKTWDTKESTNTQPSITINYTPPQATWNGGSTTSDNWSDGANWGGTAPALTGYGVVFAGAARLTPNMEDNYNVTKIDFNSGAGPFKIGATPGKTLTLSGDITQNSASLQTLNLPIALSATRTINAAAGDLTINGVISGSTYGLTKTGNYTLTLSGSAGNTCSGVTTVNAGTLVLNKSSGIGLGGGVTHVIGDGSGTATLRLDAANQIADSALVDLKNGAVLELSSGVTETIKGFAVDLATAATTAGEVKLDANAQLTIAPNISMGYSAVKITGTTGTKFIVNGAELRWTPQNLVNTFEKLVVGPGGHLWIGQSGNAWNGADTALGAVPSAFMQDQITINGGTLGLNGGDLLHKINVNANRGFTISGDATIETLVDVVIPGKITGTDKLIHKGGRDLELGGMNDFSGGLSLGAGSVTVSTPSSAGSGPIAFTTEGAQLAVATAGLVIPNPVDLSAVVDNQFGINQCGVANSFTLNGNVDLGSASGWTPQINVPSSAVTITFNGRLSGALGLGKTGPGRILLGGVNSYGGPTTISAGTLTLGANNALPTGTIITIGSTGNGATLDLGGCNQQIAGLTNAGTAANQSIGNSSATADSTLTFSSARSFTFGGVIKDAIGSGTRKIALKVDGGTLTLTAMNTYTGGTTVNNGTLEIGASGSIKGNVTVNASGVLQTDNASALEPGATIILAANPNPGTVNLSFTGTQTIQALNFGTASQATGTWGSLASSATHKSALFTGTGLLNVTSGSAAPTAVVRSADSATVCAGSSAAIHADLTGTGPWNVTWSDTFQQNGLTSSPATRTVSPSSTTTYTVTALADANGVAQAGDLAGSATITVHALPIGEADTLSTPRNTPCTISSAKLKANDSGSGLQILAVTSGTGPNPGSVSLSDTDGTITYTPKADYSGSDSFTYTLSNDQGCTVEVTATVTVGAGDGLSANVLYAGIVDGAFVARFAGIPGYTYTVEYTDLLPPNGSWAKLGSGNCKAPEPSDPHPYGVGVFQVTDPVGSSSRYYRTVWPAY